MIEEIRKGFAHISDGQVYFNHASVGPISQKVRSVIDEHINDRSRGQIDNFAKVLERSRSAKEKIGVMLNCESERVAWTPNVSSAMSILASGINWKPGDRILINDQEFPSNVYPFLNLQKSGVEIDFVKSVNGMVSAEEIERAVTPRTRLLSISLVQFVTGFRSDLEHLGEICRKNGIIFSVDAIQGAGAVNIDTKKSNVDFLSGGAHKWLMSLQGTGYLFISERLQDQLHQKNVGWLSVKDAWNLLNYDLTFKDTAERFETGTPNAIGITALDQSLSLFTDYGFNRIEKRILDNTEYFIEKISDIGAVPVLRNADRKNLAGIVSVKFDDLELIYERLKEAQITAVVREGILRFSPHFYNTKDEIDFVVDVIKKSLQT